jgi:hypothetical protein
METWMRAIAGVLLGVLLGGALNLAIIVYGGQAIGLPEGVDPGDAESLAANLHRFGPQHFIAPFLAHAAGTLLGAFVAALIAIRHRLRFGLGIGAFFLLGGITNVVLLPAPLWFEALDLILAYLPMGWLGARLAERVRAGAAPV